MVAAAGSNPPLGHEHRLEETVGGRALVVGLLVIACSCGPDWPNDQVLVSANFRYHARADAVLDPSIMDRLELHRTEFNQRFGVTNGVIDYYLFRDQDDFTQNAGCPPEHGACEVRRSVLTVDPFMEHELVHAFLNDTGAPNNPVREGIAQWAACLEPNTAQQASWPQAFTGDYYNLGQRLVGWMMAQRGASKFIDYYRTAAWTSDSVAFATQFQAFWGEPIDAIAPMLNDTQFSRSSCACRAAVLPADGTPASFVASQDYRVIEVVEDSRIELSSDSGILVVPRDCSGADALGSSLLVDRSTGPAMTLGRLSVGTYEVATLPRSTGIATVTKHQQPFGVSSCDAAVAAPVVVGDRDLTIWIDRTSRAAPTWFALGLNGPKYVSVFQNPGGVTVCSGGCSTDCMTVPEYGFNYPVTPSIGGSAVLIFEAGSTDKDAIVTIRSQIF
jgi:hypothetical protein